MHTCQGEDRVVHFSWKVQPSPNFAFLIGAVLHWRDIYVHVAFSLLFCYFVYRYCLFIFNNCIAGQIKWCYGPGCWRFPTPALKFPCESGWEAEGLDKPLKSDQAVCSLSLYLLLIFSACLRLFVLSFLLSYSILFRSLIIKIYKWPADYSKSIWLLCRVGGLNHRVKVYRWNQRWNSERCAQWNMLRKWNHGIQRKTAHTPVTSLKKKCHFSSYQLELLRHTDPQRWDINPHCVRVCVNTFVWLCVCVLCK